MALIKCPECGKEISDKATTCINCGFPLSELENTTVVEETPSIENTPSKEVIYYDLSQIRIKTIFDNGLEDGATGICNENTIEYEYRVENGNVYITRRPGVVVKLIIDGDFLVCENGKYDGYIPNESTFNATCSHENFMGNIDKHSFKDDGTYTGVSFGNPDNGTYRSEGQIIVLCGNSTGGVPNANLIHNNEFYIASYIKEEIVENFKKLFPEIENGKKISYSAPISRPTTPAVKCPYCQFENTKKISSTAKAVNVALFGIFGNKRKYQWHCNNCNSDF